MSAEQMLSVGVDIGTSTTQVVFSRLTLENTAEHFSVPKVSIVEKKLVYQSEIYATPLVDRSLIDGEALRGILEKEFRNAGYAPADTRTGAVIITGESARKENAALVLRELSGFAGDFVVSTAGPDLEAIIAGKGSGAWQYSVGNAPVVNLDVGGGTANIVLFNDGDVAAKGCVDIGGRQITLSKDWNVTYVSPSARIIAADCGARVAEGKRTAQSDLRAVCRRMADLLWTLISGEPDALLERVVTAGSTPYRPPFPPRTVFFSGGVADCVYAPHDNPLQYGDIGVLLGREIVDSPQFRQYRVVRPGETIRATVIGAGSYATTVSGSTIFYSEDLLPQKNLPVFKVTREMQRRCFDGDGRHLAEEVRWFFGQTGGSAVMLAFPGVANPGYAELKSMAKAIADAVVAAYPPGVPLILSVESDMAKALGQTVWRQLDGRPTVCIDSVLMEQDDYIDLGSPLMGGVTIPVVVKTLIYGQKSK